MQDSFRKINSFPMNWLHLVRESIATIDNWFVVGDTIDCLKITSPDVLFTVKTADGVFMMYDITFLITNQKEELEPRSMTYQAKVVMWL